MSRNRQIENERKRAASTLWIRERSEGNKNTFLFDKYESSTFRTHIGILNWLKFHLNRNCCCCVELVVHCSLNWIYEIYDQFIYYSHLTKSTPIFRCCPFAMTMPMTWSHTQLLFTMHKIHNKIIDCILNECIEIGLRALTVRLHRVMLANGNESESSTNETILANRNRIEQRMVLHWLWMLHRCISETESTSGRVYAYSQMCALCICDERTANHGS